MNWKIIIAAGLILLSTNLYAAKPDKALPFHGVFSGYLLGFGDVPAGRCDDVPDGKVAWAMASFEAWGTATHLGETYLTASHCSYGWPINDPPYVIPDGTYGEGELELTADNGDILIVSYTNGESLEPPPNAVFQEDIKFHKGGTGRFTFASGGGVDIGTFNALDGSITLQMNGVIAYSKRQK